MWHPQGGCNIEQLRQSTKATIKVERDTPGCSDRLICISSADSAAEPLCRAQEALLSIQERLSVMDTSEPLQTVRFVQTTVSFPPSIDFLKTASHRQRIHDQKALFSMHKRLALMDTP